jgi:BlaI family transcriptional regulator, penicillinase repressor
MGEYPQRLSDAEQDVMAVLWEVGPSPVRAVLEALRANGRDWAYTTAKTVLDRLEEKGYLVRDRSSHAHVYHPTLSREELARRRVDELRERLFPRSAGALIRTLVQDQLGRDEIDELRAWLEETVGEEDR